MRITSSPFIHLARRGIHWLASGRLAKTSGRMRLAGLHGPVEVIRDRWGIPHITAENEHDLFFAQGFVHAQDRFWQMEFQRRLIAGRLAEVFGKMGLTADRWMRTVGLGRIGEQEQALLSEEGRTALEAYSGGVNAYLRQRRLPVEFALLRYTPEAWRPADSLGWSKMMAWMLGANWECELLRMQLVEKLGPEQAEQLEISAEESWPVVMELTDALGMEQRLTALARSWIGPGPREGVGSNNWVLSGERTATGKPILANDMHLMMNAPAVWYENHLTCGDWSVTGVSLPGLPLVVSGHNGRVAWGFTAGYADVQDLYEERMRRCPDGGVEVETEDGWQPAEVRQETIVVRGEEPVTQEVVITRHGPVISTLMEDEDLPVLALRWTAYETSGGTMQALMGMNRAANCLDFREAVRTWNAPVLNMVYADTEGNIGYSLAGKIPLRAAGDGKTPVPGWNEHFAWRGYIPFEEMPHLYNPPEGYIASANNRVASADYPHWLGWDYVSGDRAERIVELILSQPSMAVEDVKKMQMDQVSPSAQTMARVLGSLDVEAPDLAQVVERMRAWDGTLAVDSPDAALYEVISRELLLILLKERLGDLMPRYTGGLINELAGYSTWGHHAWEWLRRELVKEQSQWFDLGGGETRNDVLRMALRRAVDFLTASQGSDIDKWTWGYHHTLTFHHTLGRIPPLDSVFSRGPYPIGGDGNTIWASASLLDRIESTDGMVGPPARFVADLGDLDHAAAVLAPGQSGQPGSPHYDDQISDWFRGEYHPVLFRRRDVLEMQRSCLELLPAWKPK